MELNSQNTCLFQPINELPFSNEFKALVASHNINTLNELLKFQALQMLNQLGFTYHLLLELVQFLKEKGFSGLLQE